MNTAVEAAAYCLAIAPAIVAVACAPQARREPAPSTTGDAPRRAHFEGDYAAGVRCTCDADDAHSVAEARARLSTCVAQFASCSDLPACRSSRATVARLAELRHCAGDAIAPKVAVYEAWAPIGEHAAWRKVTVQRFGHAFALALAPDPLFGADAIRELRDSATLRGCRHGVAPTTTDEQGNEVSSPARPSPVASSLSVEWSTRLRLFADRIPRIRQAAHASPDVMSDVCDLAPCLVLMNGDIPVGFVGAGWDVTEQLDFDHTELDAVCRRVEPTP